jgi:hypothetical protein
MYFRCKNVDVAFMFLFSIVADNFFIEEKQTYYNRYVFVPPSYLKMNTLTVSRCG